MFESTLSLSMAIFSHFWTFLAILPNLAILAKNRQMALALNGQTWPRIPQETIYHLLARIRIIFVKVRCIKLISGFS